MAVSVLPIDLICSIALWVCRLAISFTKRKKALVNFSLYQIELDLEDLASKKPDAKLMEEAIYNGVIYVN